MSPLQQRMLEDMQLRGLSARTQEAYARAVRQLAQHYQRRPDQLSDEDLPRIQFNPGLLSRLADSRDNNP